MQQYIDWSWVCFGPGSAAELVYENLLCALVLF